MANNIHLFKFKKYLISTKTMNCQIENRKRKRKTYLHCKFNRNYSAILANNRVARMAE